jgi:hypothetical protein
MRKLFLLLLALPIVALASCEKESAGNGGEEGGGVTQPPPPPPDDPTTAELLLGRWEQIRITTELECPAGETRDMLATMGYEPKNEETGGIYLEFKADNTFTGDMTGTYNVVGETLEFTASGRATLNYQILTLDESTLVFYHDQLDIMKSNLQDEKEELASIDIILDLDAVTKYSRTYTFRR